MRILHLWSPVVVWMAIIFVLSSRESIKVSDRTVINFLFFKTLHLIEYGILLLLNFRAIRNSLKKENVVIFYTAAFGLTILYAIVDEIHQSLVPTREGKLRDVIIDASGAILSWYAIAKLLPKAPPRLKEWAKTLEII